MIVKRLGLVEYAPALEAMRVFTAERGADTPDEIWLLQHPPVYTLGQAGKRPYHTIIPALATLPGASREELYAVFGVMGGFMQPQGHVQVVLGLLDDGLNPQAALERPRLCLPNGRADDRVALEEGIPLQTMARLAEMGHPLFPVTGLGRSLFGRGQIILRLPANGALCGGSDPRADGCAMPQ